MQKTSFLFVLIIVLVFFSCGRRSSRTPKEKDDTTTCIETAKPQLAKAKTINIYIENSGSMDGYVCGNTEFKGAIRDLMVLLKHYYGEGGSIKVYFINSQIRGTDTKTDLATFSQNINTHWKVEGENRTSSNLNNVFKMILEKTDKQTISILFSDCIYSIKGKDAEGLLSDEKSLTEDAFLTRWRVDSLKLATTIVKMKSKFTGTYYDKDNQKTQLSGELRPYYICVIGNNDIMLDFNQKIQLEKDKIEGFDNKYVISTGATDDLYYSVLMSTDNAGRFKATRALSTKEYVHGIEDVDVRSRNRDENAVNKFAFAVAIDFKNVAAEEDYLLTPKNYTLSDNNFIVKEIKPIDKNKVSASDWLKISSANPTHIIVLEATGTAISDVKVALKKQMPQWIEQTTTMDDRYIRKNLDKTFGIKYLIEGISEAYQVIYPSDVNFFEFEIKIKK